VNRGRFCFLAKIVNSPRSPMWRRMGGSVMDLTHFSGFFYFGLLADREGYHGFGKY
jgi:hypothetical protein